MIISHEQAMLVALDQARLAAVHGDVPVGTVVVHNCVIIAARHLWFLSKKEATLHPELLVLESNGLTQIGLDMQSSGRAIEIQKKHNLSVFNQYEE